MLNNKSTHLTGTTNNIYFERVKFLPVCSMRLPPRAWNPTPCTLLEGVKLK
jgi:hypothetical protein